MGRPKIQFDDDTIEKIGEMAMHQCRMHTIAEALCVPISTLKRRFGQFCKEKRAEGKAEKLKQQYEDKSPTMLVWFGKQHLEQTDKAELKDMREGLQINISPKEKGKPDIKLVKGA